MKQHRKYMRDVKSWGIAPRIVAAFILLIIVPYICLAAVVFWFYQEHAVSSLKEATMDTLTAAASGIHAAMLERQDDSMSIYYNGCVELLGTGKALTRQEEQMITEHLSAISYANTDVLAAYLITEQGNFHSGGNYAGALSIMEPYEEEVAAAGGRCLWYATNRLYGKAYENKYILARSLNSETEKNVGVLYLVLNDNMITEAFGQLSTEYAKWYLTDADGNILYASDALQIGARMDVSMLSLTKRKGSHVAAGREQKEILEAYSLMDVGWYCISKIQMQSFHKDTFSLAMPFLLIAFICIQFMLFVLRILQKHVFFPLRLLKSSMDDYAQNDIAQTKAEVFGIGEFKSLSEHFNHMTLRISRLLEAYKKEEEEKSRQRMKALSAQLTPHFVYNALSTIKWVAALNHQEKIQCLVESLIGIFMNAARTDDGNYTLRDEIELVKNYAVIQKARFMNFELEIDVEEGCLGCRMRKLLLQPIVENAIVHGLNRGKVKGGRIWVRAWEEDGILHLFVEDNGAGFDVKKWRDCPVKNEEHTNIGIVNVEEIIRLEYGAQYSMQIESIPGKGTKVAYTLPAIYIEHKADKEKEK